jgi:hypothetical protein
LVTAVDEDDDTGADDVALDDEDVEPVLVEPPLPEVLEAHAESTNAAVASRPTRPANRLARRAADEEVTPLR